MKDIVVLPVFDRPEFLWACIENLYFNIRGARDKWIWITEDIHADKPKSFQTQIELLAAIRQTERLFNSHGTVRYVATTPHTTYGNSYNVLSALQAAATFDVNKIYLIEDDVMVTPDFFEWNDQVFSQYDAPVVCAGRLNRSLNFQMSGPDAMDESIKDVNAVKKVSGAYNSWATCFSVDFLRALPQFSPEGFRPGLEQDILIQKYMRGRNISSIWPYVPRAYHMGWYSYHRSGYPLTGTLEERVKALQSIVTDQKKIQTVAGSQSIDAFPSEEHEQFTRLYLK